MKAARFRLIVTAVLFVGWLGYLAYLALGFSKPVTLSNSQMLVATHFVKADIALDPAGKPSPQVLRRETFGTRGVPDEKLTIDNLDEARLPNGKPISAAGSYLLLLRQTGPTRFEVVGAPTGQGNDLSAKHLWVYPWSAEIERQLRERLAKAD
jgi:hypothetical protein